MIYLSAYIGENTKRLGAYDTARKRRFIHDFTSVGKHHSVMHPWPQSAVHTDRSLLPSDLRRQQGPITSVYSAAVPTEPYLLQESVSWYNSRLISEAKTLDCALAGHRKPLNTVASQ